jgi:CubicO group peptidase (beta-lactamase class C family)
MSPSPVVPSAPIADFVTELDALVAEAMGEWKIPGLAIAVVQNGGVALLKAYGLRDVEAQLPITIDTHFMICSITKSFTATGLALLVDERRLDWKKPVRDYIPEFRLHDAVATDRVTVRDLLCHHSGLPRHDWIHLPGDFSPAQMLAAMRYLEPSDDIRSTFQYQNLGYLVAGMVAERISGQSWTQFTRTRLTDKLRMTVTFTAEELAATPDAAVPYSMDGDTRLRAKLYPIRTIPAGGINTSIKSLANWLLFHLDKGEFDGKRLLSTGLIRDLHAPRVHIGASEFSERRCALRFRLRRADLPGRARRGPQRWLDRLGYAHDDAARPRRWCRRVHKSGWKSGPRHSRLSCLRPGLRQGAGAVA